MAENRFLVVKLAAIGDVVMALPFLLSLSRQGGRITWVCGKQVASLLKATRLVDELIEVDEGRLLAGPLFQKVAALFQIWWKIGGRFFDRIFTLHADSRYQAVSWCARASERTVFKPVPGRYHAQEYLRVLDRKEGAIAREIEFPVLHLPVLDFSRPKPILVLAPGGAKNVLADDALRRWPVTAYAQVAAELAREFHIILIGTHTDQWVIPYFNGIEIENRISVDHLLETVALLKASALLITHDSGPLHLAKLVDCPVIALFGPTNPYEKTSDQEKVEVIWGGKGLACRPCYYGKKFAACFRNVCLEQITPRQVIELAQQKLVKI